MHGIPVSGIVYDSRMASDWCHHDGLPTDHSE